jgi:hypothetical protein
MKMTRRNAARLFLGAPVIAAAGASTLLAPRSGLAQESAPATQPPPEPEPSPLGQFLARQENDLSSEQKDKLRKDVTDLEQTLKPLRDYPLANDVPPAGTFAALRSRRVAKRS